MSSKMREALRDLLRLYENENQCYPGARPNQLIDEIAQRYGDLEFTREEVRGMLEEAAAYVHYIHGAGEAFPPPPQYELEATANHILSRHTEGESESGDKPDPLQALTKRVAAIEKRLLADGHSEGCRKGHSEGFYRVIDCTCGHDEIRK